MQKRRSSWVPAPLPHLKFLCSLELGRSITYRVVEWLAFIIINNFTFSIVTIVPHLKYLKTWGGKPFLLSLNWPSAGDGDPSEEGLACWLWHAEPHWPIWAIFPHPGPISHLWPLISSPAKYLAWLFQTWKWHPCSPTQLWGHGIWQVSWLQQWVLARLPDIFIVNTLGYRCNCCLCTSTEYQPWTGVLLLSIMCTSIKKSQGIPTDYSNY